MNVRLAVALEKGHRSLRAAEAREDRGTIAFGAHCDFAITRFFYAEIADLYLSGDKYPMDYS
jgi:hypothetical protein